MKRFMIVVFFLALLLCVNGGCTRLVASKTMAIAPEAVQILPFRELTIEEGLRQYSFENAGLGKVLGCEGFIEEELTLGGQIIRRYYSCSNQLLAESFGFPSYAEDIYLSDGTLVCNCCYNDGAARTYVYRRSTDGGIEMGSYNKDLLIEDALVEYRTIAERYDPDMKKFRVSYIHHNAPDDRIVLEYNDLSAFDFSDYAPSTEFIGKMKEAAWTWRISRLGLLVDE